MAQDLNRNEVVGEAPLAPGSEPSSRLAQREEPALLVTPPRRSPPSPHASRFLLAYVLLGIVIGATAIGFAVVLVNDGSSDRQWSAWTPQSNGTDRVREIADHVAAGYRLRSGAQLAAAIPRAPSSVDPPVIAVALDSQALFDSEQQFTTHSMENGLMYFLCGGAESCTIAGGQPTIARHRLLRREALELALYTFRYMDGVDSVVTFLPPRAPETQQEKADEQAAQPTTAVYFRKDDLKPFVDEPLTLTLKGRPVTEEMSRQQARLVDQLTGPALYRFSFQQAPDGQSSILILSPFAQTS